MLFPLLLEGAIATLFFLKCDLLEELDELVSCSHKERDIYMLKIEFYKVWQDLKQHY